MLTIVGKSSKEEPSVIGGFSAESINAPTLARLPIHEKRPYGRIGGTSTWSTSCSAYENSPSSGVSFALFTESRGSLLSQLRPLAELPENSPQSKQLPIEETT